MTEDNKQSEEITSAGAVELEENALDQAAGGLLPAVDEAVQKVSPENKYAPAHKIPGGERYSGDFHIKF